MRRFLRALPVLLMLLVLAAIAWAQTYPSATYKTFSGDVSTETTIATAASGKNLTIQSAVATVTTAGIVVFRDGTAGTVIGKVYLASNTPTKIPQDLWGVGLPTTASSGIVTAELSGSTLTILLRCTEQ